MKKTLLFVMVLFLLPLPAYAVPVDLELSLLIDVSGSIDSSEFTLQRQGYVDAFDDTDIWAAISQGLLGSIAVNAVYWSSENMQQVAVNWSHIDSQQDAYDFADDLLAAARPFNNQTGIGAALVYGTGLFSNGYEGTRNVIDVSGDGTNNEATSSLTGRTYALGNGVDTINGLVIGGSTTVYNHYNTQVIGGTNAFLMAVDSFSDFGSAIDDKLIREIQGVPEPTTMLLLGTGLIGLATLRRKFKK